MATQPLELILARNLLAGLTTAALLCDAEGTIVFLNDAAGELLGRRFDELGQMTPEQWTREFGPSGAPAEDGAGPGLMIARAGRSGTGVSERAHLRARGQLIDVELSALPLSTVDGFKGAIVVLSPGQTSED